MTDRNTRHIQLLDTLAELHETRMELYSETTLEERNTSARVHDTLEALDRLQAMTLDAIERNRDPSVQG